MNNLTIKFRAWDECQKIMHYDFQFITSGGGVNDWIVFVSDKQPTSDLRKWIDNPFFSQQLKIMQWTGHFDKNNRLIFEGDVKRDEIEEESGDVRMWYVCVWIQEWSRFAWLLIGGEYEEYLAEGADVLDGSMEESYGVFAEEMDSTVIVGNIWANPELLTRKPQEPNDLFSE